MTNRIKKAMTADEIATRHCCDLVPAGSGGTGLMVWSSHQQGDVQDSRRKERCIEALKRAGVMPRGLVS